MAQVGYLKNRRGTQSIIRLPQHGNRGDEASVSGKDYRHDGRRWVQLAGSDQAEDVRKYITPGRTKRRYESNPNTNVLTDELLDKLGSLEALRNAQDTFDLIEDLLDTLIANYGEPFTAALLAKLNAIDAGATAGGGGGQITNELYDDDVEITTSGEWVSLGVPVPEEGDAEFIKVQLRVESETFDWFEVYLPDIRSRSAGTAGAAATVSQRVYIRDVPDSAEPCLFRAGYGRRSSVHHRRVRHRHHSG